VVFGIGAGWNVEEMENHGAQFKRRWKIVREKVLAMREIWTKEAAEFHGEFVNFDPIWSYPKPVQPGGPPVLLGSQSPKTFDRVAEYCDGWLPINFPRANFEDGIRKLREAGKRAGRDNLSLTMFAAPGKEDDVKRLAELGFNRLIFALPAAPRDTVLPMLDRYAAVAAKMK
jgi:alkanesulfonate monooxygenase SsuD/methylene tetrahydromethanopterin reductase-like flavin-dependent oxidoreductase (luciferase family)